MVGIGLRVDEAGVGLMLGDPYSAPCKGDGHVRPVRALKGGQDYEIRAHV